MHISYCGLYPAVCTADYAVTAVGLVFAVHGIKEDDIPKIGLVADIFFAIWFIMIPIPPGSVHPLMCGLIGIILGRGHRLYFPRAAASYFFSARRFNYARCKYAYAIGFRFVFIVYFPPLEE